jgi:hypothetical protein
MPARRAAEASRRATEARERDPGWRVEDALRLLTDAGKLASDGGRHIDAANVSALQKALELLSLAAKVQMDPPSLLPLHLQQQQ